MIQNATADDKSAAKELLKGRLEAVVMVLQSKKHDKESKKKEVVEIVTPIFDFALMSKLCLGRKHWPGLTADKKERFKEVFIKCLQETYLDQLTLSTNETIIYHEPLQKKKKVHIPTDVISKKYKFSILYKLYKTKKSWKIYDVEVEGVSIVSTYRSQFSAILSTGTIDDLIVKLENMEKKLQPASSQQLR
jgi:phospholipid transport system substrate-binding protein